MMTGPEYNYHEWAILDEEGFIIRLRDDAPEEVKRSYEEYMSTDCEIVED